MTTEEDFQQMLDANPADHGTRLIFADWLQDRDDGRADGYRVLGLLERVPTDPTWGYLWTSAVGRREIPTDMACVLPRDWYEMIDGGMTGNRTFIPELRLGVEMSRRERDDRVALAFARLPDSRRLELLGATV
jgi:uncharacterized protein (TIGR02996 family)